MLKVLSEKVWDKQIQYPMGIWVESGSAGSKGSPGYTFIPRLQEEQVKHFLPLKDVCVFHIPGFPGAYLYAQEHFALYTLIL